MATEKNILLHPITNGAVETGTNIYPQTKLSNLVDVTTAQTDAINSGITSAKVSTYDGYASTISGKQDTISDLATIRSGAAAGATALQSVPNTYRTSADQDTIDNALDARLDTIEGKESSWDAKLSDAQVNGTSVVTSGVANIVTNTAYNASTNKIATMSDLPEGEVNITLTSTSISDGTTTLSIAGKQDTISDLATIRSGAALGTTSVQDVKIGSTSVVDANKVANITYDSSITQTSSSNAPTTDAVRSFVNSSIESVAANYVTSDAAGNNFATYAALSAATTFYHSGAAYTPTKNDYAMVAADENHDGKQARYINTSSTTTPSWSYQYTVGQAFTAAQQAALDSGITASKVSTYDGYASSKQDALTTQTAYTTQGSATKVAQISTNTLGQVTAINEIDISFPTVDQTYNASSTNAQSGVAVAQALSGMLPACPTTTDGTFTLRATASSGVVTYAWVSDSNYVVAVEES